MHSERIPIDLWAEVMDSVVYLKNGSPSRALNRSTPFEALTGERPNLSLLRVVGCAAWSLVLKAKRDHKLAPRARLCCFLGYASTQKAYKLWDPIEHRLVISRDVTFDESISAARLERPKIAMAELEQNLQILHSQPPSHIDAPNTSIGHDVFESVGDLPRADEAVELDRPAGAGEEERREEPQESPERGHHQFQGWDYEVDPRFARSPAPTPEPQVNEQAENEDQAENRFVTRSGRQWGLASVNTNECEDELDDFLGRRGQDEYHPSNVRIPLWSGDFSPHSLAALALQAVGGMEPRSWK